MSCTLKQTILNYLARAFIHLNISVIKYEPLCLSLDNHTAESLVTNKYVNIVVIQ